MARRLPLIQPMLAQLATSLPSPDGAYAYEVKWDGYRVIVYVDGGVTVMSRGAQDYTRRVPELADLAGRLGAHRAVLDGELVAPVEGGRTSFQALQNRIGPRSPTGGHNPGTPIALMVFDLLHIDGESLLATPYRARREHLEALELGGPWSAVPPVRWGGGAEMLEASVRIGHEGIIAKRINSLYTPGRRTGDWLKIKNHQRQEFVIAGWTAGAGSRAGRLGALLLGYYADGAMLVFAGKVGTGFNHRILENLDTLLTPLARTSSPFDAGQPPRGAHFVEPRLVCEVEFTEWTNEGTLRHPSFKGLREDKDPSTVIRERPL